MGWGKSDLERAGDEHSDVVRRACKEFNERRQRGMLDRSEEKDVARELNQRHGLCLTPREYRDG